MLYEKTFKIENILPVKVKVNTRGRSSDLDEYIYDAGQRMFSNFYAKCYILLIHYLGSGSHKSTSNLTYVINVPQKEDQDLS